MLLYIISRLCFSSVYCSGDTKKLKLCKRVGWLRDGLFTTGFMEINVKEARQKGIFSQPRRVTLIQKEDSVFQSQIIKGHKTPTCEQLSSLMVKPGSSTTGLIEVRGELIPNKITVEKENVHYESPGKLVALGKASSLGFSGSESSAVKNADPSPFQAEGTNINQPDRKIVSQSIESVSDTNNPSNSDEQKSHPKTAGSSSLSQSDLKRVKPRAEEYLLTEDGLASLVNTKHKRNMNESPHKETSRPIGLSCRPVHASMQLVIHNKDGKLEVGNLRNSSPSSSLEPVNLSTSTSDSNFSHMTSSKTLVKAKNNELQLESPGAKADSVISSRTDIQLLQTFGNPKVDIVKLDIDFSRHDVLNMDGLILSPIKLATTTSSCVDTATCENSCSGRTKTPGKHSVYTSPDVSNLDSVSDRNTENPRTRSFGKHTNLNFSKSMNKLPPKEVSVPKVQALNAENCNDSPCSVTAGGKGTSVIHCAETQRKYYLRKRKLKETGYGPSDSRTISKSNSARDDLSTSNLSAGEPPSGIEIKSHSNGDKFDLTNAHSTQASTVEASLHSDKNVQPSVPSAQDCDVKASLHSETNFQPSVPSAQDSDVKASLHSDKNVQPSVPSAPSAQDSDVKASLHSDKNVQPSVPSTKGSDVEASFHSEKNFKSSLHATQNGDTGASFINDTNVIQCTQESDVEARFNCDKKVLRSVHSTQETEKLILAPMQLEVKETFTAGDVNTTASSNMRVSQDVSLNSSESSVDIHCGNKKSGETSSPMMEMNLISQRSKEQSAENSNPEVITGYITSSLVTSEIPQKNNSGGYPTLQISSVYSLSEKEAKQLFPETAPSSRTKLGKIKQEPVDTYKYSNVLIPEGTTNDDLAVGPIENSTAVITKEPVDTSGDFQTSQLQATSIPVVTQQGQTSQSFPFANNSNFNLYNIISSKESVVLRAFKNPQIPTITQIPTIAQIPTVTHTPPQTLPSSSFQAKSPVTTMDMSTPSQQTANIVNKQVYTWFPSMLPATSQQSPLGSLHPVQMSTFYDNTSKPISASPASTQNTITNSGKSPCSSLYIGVPSTINAMLASRCQTPTVLNLPIVPQSPGNKRILITNVSKVGCSISRSASVCATGGQSQTIPITTSLISKVFSAINSSESGQTTVVSSIGIASKPISSTASTSSICNSAWFAPNAMATGTNKGKLQSEIATSSKPQNNLTSELRKTFLITTSNGEKRLVNLPSNADAAGILSRMASTKAYQLVVSKPNDGKQPEENKEKDVKLKTLSKTLKKIQKSPDKYEPKTKKTFSILKIKIQKDPQPDVRRSSRERKRKRPYSPPRDTSRSPRGSCSHTPAKILVTAAEARPFPSSQGHQIPFIKTEPIIPEAASDDEYYDMKENPQSRQQTPPSYINREDRVKRLKELMKEKEKTLEEMLKRRQQEIKDKLADPELFDL